MRKTILTKVSTNPSNVKARKRKKLSTRAKNLKLPLWVQAIPESQAHGSGTLQKRLWRITSDIVRIRDWYHFEGKCIATGKKLASWKDGQAGHFIRYEKCNGMFKFCPANIHLQSPSSNGWGDMDDWDAYEKELQHRHGLTRQELKEMNNREHATQIKTQDVLNQIRTLLEFFKTLPEQPDYWEKSYNLLTESPTTKH